MGHSSSKSPYSFFRVKGSPGAYPTSLWEKGKRQGYTLDWSPVHYRATCRQNNRMTCMFLEYEKYPEKDLNQKPFWHKATVLTIKALSMETTFMVQLLRNLINLLFIWEVTVAYICTYPYVITQLTVPLIIYSIYSI